MLIQSYTPTGLWEKESLFFYMFNHIYTTHNKINFNKFNKFNKLFATEKLRSTFPKPCYFNFSNFQKNGFN